MHSQLRACSYNATTTQPFYGSLDFVQDNSGEPVPEKTFTHSHLLWSSIIPYLLPPYFTIHVILLQFTCLTVFFHNLSPVFFGLPLDLTPSTSYYIQSSPNHCLPFTAHANTIATCFAVVPKLCHLILVSLSLHPLLGTLSCSLTPHIHLTMLLQCIHSKITTTIITTILQPLVWDYLG